MEPTVYLESIALLESWAIEYQRFADRAAQGLRVAEHRFRARWEALEHAYRVQKAHISELREELETCEDEEKEDVQAALEEAKAHLEEMRAALTEVRSQYEEFRRRAQELTTLLEEKVPKAKAFLRNRAAELRAYVTLMLPGAGGSAPTSGASQAAPAASQPQGAESAPSPSSPPGDPSHYKLPAGFRWVVIDDIQFDQPGDETFSKVAREEFRRGWHDLPKVLESLQNRLHMTPADNSFYFYRLDLRAGRSYADGLQRVYDAFFGSDPIRLEKVPGSDAWRVIDGRHRLRLAVELGWTMVPVVAHEPKQQGDS
jgi:hypothetical protein